MDIVGNTDAGIELSVHQFDGEDGGVRRGAGPGDDVGGVALPVIGGVDGQTIGQRGEDTDK